MKKQISTSKAPKAIGPYSQAILSGDTLYCSGQLGIDPSTGEFVPGGIKEQTAQIFQNIKAVLEEENMDFSHIVKTTVLLSDMSLFAEMNEVYASNFKGTFPARSAFAVKTLPKNALVEIEVIAIK